MERTLILIVTHRGVSYETEKCLRALDCPSRIDLLGLSNLAKARSAAFDQALRAVELAPSIDTVLCVDDDMIFEPEQAKAVVELSRREAALVSGIALSTAEILCARPLPKRIIGSQQKWVSGFGFLAVPVAELVRVAPRLPVCGGLRVWCQTGEHPEYPGEWIGEDFWFCSHFGGVIMAPIAVGHQKPLELRATREQVHAVMYYDASAPADPRKN
jgi:hypothetical protein